MSERETDYPQRVWLPLSADTAAGYELDLLGAYLLKALVIYAPDTDRIRNIGLRELQRLDPHYLGATLRQNQPPTETQLAEKWEKNSRLITQAIEAVGNHLEQFTEAATEAARHVESHTDSHRTALQARIAEVTDPQRLTRQPDDKPDDFYRRIAEAHFWLAKATDKPTLELADRAGVPVGTAGAWVSRARARGHFDQFTNTTKGDQE